MAVQIFSTTKTRADSYKFFGAYLPSRVIEYLTLYCLAKGTTKTKVVKCIMEEWIKKNHEIESDSDLIQQIVQRVNMRWKVEKSAESGLTFNQFKSVVQKELEEKGIKPAYIELIMVEIRQ